MWSTGKWWSCLHLTHIEFPITKHYSNDIVIAVCNCNAFGKFANFLFMVIIHIAQDIAHRVSLKAHIRMRSTTFWPCFIAPRGVMWCSWRHRNITSANQSCGWTKLFNHKYYIISYVLLKITRGYETSLIMNIFLLSHCPQRSFHHLMLSSHVR